MSDETCVDIAVVDQREGLTMPCDWLEFCQLPIGEGNGKVAVGCLRTPWMAAGIHFKGESN